ncbi:Uncharacterised protein [Klebsiella variicola]|nr:Uncharacterised protein [Klebsiella variicola]
MVLFFRKYGFLFIPPVYWLIYLGVRLTYNGLVGEFSPDFFQSIRHDGVFIICSLCVFYFFCLEVGGSDVEFSANILFGFVNGMVASHLLCHSGTINRHSLNGALLS